MKKKTYIGADQVLQSHYGGLHLELHLLIEMGAQMSAELHIRNLQKNFSSPKKDQCGDYNGIGKLK